MSQRLLRKRTPADGGVTPGRDTLRAMSARIRGTDVSNLRTYLREKKGPQVERDLLSRLPGALRTVYLETSPVTWNPVEAQAELYEAAASLLFPDVAEPVVELHRMLARLSYSGIYRLFIRIPSVEYIAKRAATVWRKYYDTGNADTENSDEKSLDFVVTQFPTLPNALRQATTGHLYTLAEMTGAKHLDIAPPANTPEKWVWQIRWGA